MCYVIFTRLINKKVFVSMSDFLASIFGKVHKQQDPAFAQKLDEAKKELQSSQGQVVAILVSSVAFATFGIANAASGSFISLPIILVSLPVGFLSYNGYQATKNLYDILDNLTNYRNSYGLESSFDAQKIKSKLKEGTYFFEWTTNANVDEMVRSGQAR
jgi:hypothetical protein